MPKKDRTKIVTAAKQKIRSLISRGFNINVAKASPFTQVLVDQRRRDRVAGLTGQMPSRLAGGFDNSSQGSKKSGGKFK